MDAFAVDEWTRGDRIGLAGRRLNRPPPPHPENKENRENRERGGNGNRTRGLANMWRGNRIISRYNLCIDTFTVALEPTTTMLRALRFAD